MEDTYDLLGHALRKALGVIARQQGRGLAEVATEAGAAAEVVVSASSLKAALDLDWDDPQERTQALVRVLEALEAIEGRFSEEDGAFPRKRWRPDRPSRPQGACESRMWRKTPTGRPAFAAGWRASGEFRWRTPQMRHGRKSKNRRFDGYERHVLRDLDTELVRAVGVTPANAPEASVTDDLAGDLAPQEVELGELHVDRAYLSSESVRKRPEHLEVYCKAWPVRNATGLYPKTAFELDWERDLLRCPAGVSRCPSSPEGWCASPRPRALGAR